MVVILLVWAPVEDWEVVDSSPDSFEKALQAVSSRLPNKAAQTAAGSVGWIFVTALKVNMDNVLSDPTLVCSVQRCSEGLQQRTLALEQEPRGTEEPTISDSEAVSDGDNECYETEGLCLAARLLCRRK